jgi:hypothetical protein
MLSVLSDMPLILADACILHCFMPTIHCSLLLLYVIAAYDCNRRSGRRTLLLRGISIQVVSLVALSVALLTLGFSPLLQVTFLLIATVI